MYKSPQKNRGIGIGIALLILAACGQTAWAGRMVLPGATWDKATPESQGVDSARLKAAVDYLQAHSGHNGVKRLVVVRNGWMIWKGPEAERRQRVWSVTKAFTSTAQGLLIDDGKCTLRTSGPQPGQLGRQTAHQRRVGS